MQPIILWLRQIMWIKYKTVGVLPMVQIKSLGSEHAGVHAFLNYGGVLADDEETEKELFVEAGILGRKLGVSNLELRHIFDYLFNGYDREFENHAAPKPMTHKVRMLLELPTRLQNCSILNQNFAARSKAQKEGLVALIGGAELLVCYQVFSVNMRIWEVLCIRKGYL